MATPSNPFDGLARYSHVEKIEDAVVETLRADAGLVAFFAAGGGIHRSPLPEQLTSLQRLPVCCVSSKTLGTEFQLARETEQTLQVLITVAHEERRDRLSTGDKTIRTVVDWIFDVIAANEALMVPFYSNVPLVERLESFGIVDFGVALGQGPSTGELVEVARYTTIGATYWYFLTMDGFTRE